MLRRKVHPLKSFSSNSLNLPQLRFEYELCYETKTTKSNDTNYMRMSVPSGMNSAGYPTPNSKSIYFYPRSLSQLMRSLEIHSLYVSLVKMKLC